MSKLDKTIDIIEKLNKGCIECYKQRGVDVMFMRIFGMKRYTVLDYALTMLNQFKDKEA